MARRSDIDELSHIVSPGNKKTTSAKTFPRVRAGNNKIRVGVDASMVVHKNVTKWECTRVLYKCMNVTNVLLKPVENNILL